MRCQVRDASDSVALHFYILTVHLSNEMIQSVQLHDKELVLGWCAGVSASYLEHLIL